jgi:hypothetical protein
LSALDPNSLSADHIIELPSATSEGLALALDSIRSSISGDRLLLNGKSLDAIVAALDVAHAYDMPIVSRLILGEAKTHLHSRPFDLFTIAAIVNDTDVMSHAVAISLTYDYDSHMAANARRLLVLRAPAAILQLKQSHQAKVQFQEELRELLISTQPMPDGKKYAKSCLGIYGGCATSSTKYTVVRAQAAEAVYNMYVALDGVGVQRVVDATVGAVIECEKCARRFGACFKNALRVAEARAMA